MAGVDTIDPAASFAAEAWSNGNSNDEIKPSASTTELLRSPSARRLMKASSASFKSVRRVLATPYPVTGITKFEHRPLLVYCLLS